jgi:hypothetical protein
MRVSAAVVLGIFVGVAITVAALGGLSCARMLQEGGRLRVSELEIAAPGAAHPAIILTAGPDGQGSIVVNGRNGEPLAIHLGVDQNNNGHVSVMMPAVDKQGHDVSRHLDLSAESGIALGGQGPGLWQLGVDDAGGWMRMCRSDGVVYMQSIGTPGGRGELDVLDGNMVLKPVE